MKLSLIDPVGFFEIIDDRYYKNRDFCKLVVAAKADKVLKRGYSNIRDLPRTDMPEITQKFYSKIAEYLGYRINWGLKLTPTQKEKSLYGRMF